MLKPGDIAPDFTLPAARGTRAETVNLSQQKAEIVVLFFYPHDFSFVCPTEVRGFHNHLAEFAAAQASIIGVSVDAVQTHLEWIKELGGIDYPLAADVGGAVARAYGVLDEREGAALRATFLMGREREVLYAIASQANVGRSVHETLRVVQCLRSGRMCPADFNPVAEVPPAAS